MVSTDGMTTTTTVVSYPTIVTKFGVSTQQAEDAISKVLSAGGDRATVVSTALQYMGDPYVEGGASHEGIDCSGLTMVAYAAVGIPLVHYVPTQDAAATTIPESEAQPGDLVVYDNETTSGSSSATASCCRRRTPARSSTSCRCTRRRTTSPGSCRRQLTGPAHRS